MLKQPDRESRNVNDLFYEMEGRQIQKMNKVLAGVQLTKVEERRVVEQIKQAQGIMEQLKAENQMEWVARMNNIQACAREIVDEEMIYA